MKRRNFIGALGVGTVASALAKPAIAQSSPEINWRLQSSYPKSLNTIYGAGDSFAKFVSDATDGKFKIQVFAAGELIPPLSIVDGVQAGTVEMGHTGAYFYIGKDPAFAFGTCIPFGPNARQQNGWFYQGGGNDLYNEFLATYQIHHLPIGNTGTQMGGWFRKEIKSVEDIKGIKMRIGGLAGNVLQKLGLVPTQIAAGDIYPSLERGTIDAAEFVGPYDDQSLGLAKIAPYYYFPGFWEGSASMSLFINVNKWNELPERYRAVMSQAAMAAGAEMTAEYDAQNPVALRKLISEGTQLRAFPADVLKASYAAARELYGELSAQSPAFKKLFDHQIAFRDQTYQWWQISDFSYDSLMLRARQDQW